MKTALIVSDFGAHHCTGGAQITLSHLLTEALQRDYFVSVFHYDSDINELRQEHDIVISMNLELLHRNNHVMDYILSHPRHIRYEQDSNTYLRQSVRQELYESAQKVVFLTDYHREYMAELYGDYMLKVPHAIVYPQISDNFKQLENQNREKAILHVGLLHPLKGVHNLLEQALYCVNQKFVVAGFGDRRFVKILESFSNVQFLGEISYQSMPEIYNRYTDFYYHPVQQEPFCRTVLEAIMCGMKTDTSDNIGVLKEIEKHGKDEVIQRALAGAAHFWGVVDD